MTFPWLTVLALVPMAGALITFLIKGKDAKLVGIAFAVLTLGFGVVAFVLSNGDALLEKHLWIAPIGAWYSLALDGMGRAMVLLTVILVPIVMIYEWFIGEKDPEANESDDSRKWSSGTYFALALLLESLALFVFMANDVLLFYLFFEATLIPMYFMIGGWGGAKRAKAALKFLLFNLAGGLVMLFAVVGTWAQSAAAGSPSFLISDLAGLDISSNIGKWLWLGFFIAFAIKAPMVPVHTWLPDMAEQSTPGTATLMSGVLDKMGTFGMLRICLEVFPEASKWATPVVIVLAVISILYGAVMVIASTNLMRLVAFTSISHFGFMVLGLFTMTTQSITGSVFYMFNHGFSTAALFLAVGFMVKRRGSADIKDFGGVAQKTPVLAGVLLLAGLSALGLPGFSTFISEFMVLAGSWGRHPWHIAVAAIGLVLAALYVMLLIQRTTSGEPTVDVEARFQKDLSVRERAVIAPLIAIMLVFGFFPKPMTDVINPTAKDVMVQLEMTDPAPVNGGK